MSIRSNYYCLKSLIRFFTIKEHLTYVDCFFFSLLPPSSTSANSKTHKFWSCRDLMAPKEIRKIKRSL